MQPSSTVRALFLTGFVLLNQSGCDDVDEDSADAVDTTDAAREDSADVELASPPSDPAEAYVASAYVWKPAVVPVCWINPAPWNDAHRAWVRDAVVNSWSRYAAIDFVGWNACTPKDNGVRIVIDESKPRSYVGTSSKGKDPSMWLNFTFNSWGTSCKDKVEYCVRAIAVHEFGHVVGFDHEQNRPDTPAWCAQDTVKVGDTVIGPWDANSVMNYCGALWNNGGALSAGDIAAVVQVYGPRFRWGSLGGGITTLATGLNLDGRLEVFARGTDGAPWHTWQTSPGGGWSGWAPLGGHIVGTPAVGRNADGRLEVFAQGTDGALWHTWQTSPGGSWSGWAKLGGWVMSPTVSSNKDGRLEVFGVGSDGALWHNWQTTPNGGWSGWASLAGQLTNSPAAITNADGRIEVFARGTDLALYHIWQTAPDGGWSGWVSLGGGLAGPIAAGKNGDGRLEVFVQGLDNAAYHIWQTSAGGGWSSWSSLGGVVKGVGVATNLDGRLELFGWGSDNAIHHTWQTSPNGGWGGWVSLGGAFTWGPVAGRNADGRLEVLGIGTDGAGWNAWQNTPGGTWN